MRAGCCLIHCSYLSNSIDLQCARRDIYNSDDDDDADANGID